MFFAPLVLSACTIRTLVPGRFCSWSGRGTPFGRAGVSPSRAKEGSGSARSSSARDAARTFGTFGDHRHAYFVHRKDHLHDASHDCPCGGDELSKRMREFTNSPVTVSVSVVVSVAVVSSSIIVPATSVIVPPGSTIGSIVDCTAQRMDLCHIIRTHRSDAFRPCIDLESVRGASGWQRSRRGWVDREESVH